MHRHTRWLALAALLLVLGCNQEKSGDATGTSSTSSSSGTSSTTTTTGTEAGASATVQPSTSATEVTMPSGLKYVEVLVGTGAEAGPGKRVNVKYAGTLTNGTPFDSGAYEFTIGAREVIPGWDQGISGMKVGGKRKLTIPPDLAYGASGSPPVIPPNATLLFDVELLSVK